MPPKRKIRNLPRMNDKEKVNPVKSMSFFDPVYQNDNMLMNENESDSEFSVNSSSQQQKYQDKNKNESNDLYDPEQSPEISVSKIVSRIQQIQGSIEQARKMLESMEQFKHLVPGSQEQSEKLHNIIENLEEQQAGYVNLLNLIKLTNKEKAALLEKISAPARSTQSNDDDVDDEDEDEAEDEDEDDEIICRREVKSPVRPRIESKIGFTPQSIIPPTPTVPPTINSSDTEQNNRNDNSNYDSLVGSLKSDTLNWKEQQLTSGDEESDGENEREIERNLMFQKEQLRALQGQKRALLALKKRTQQRLVEQQQKQVTNKKTTNVQENASEDNLLSDINNLRDRLQLLRNLYEQKHQVEIQEMKNPSKKPSAVTSENRLKNLHHVREQLNELEQLVSYYQMDLVNQPDEETTVYEEASIQPDDAQRLKALIMQERQKALSSSASTSSTTTTNNNNNATPKPLDRLSNELAAKRLELEEAKSALTRLQQMVKKIETDKSSSSNCSTPIPSNATKPTRNNNYEMNVNQFQYTPTSSQKTPTNNSNTRKTSLLSSILSPKPTEQQQQQKTSTIRNSYADAKMAAQHREMERLLESRQRLHTIKDQIASLHQNMTTPPTQSKKEATNEVQLRNQFKNNLNESKIQANVYEDKMNDSRNIRSNFRPTRQDEEMSNTNDSDDSELYRFECESGDGEEINDDEDDGSDTEEETRPRMKQGNFHTAEDIVAEHEQRLLSKNTEATTDELSKQMREVYRCLTTFIQEQKAFNQSVEEHFKASAHPAPTQTPVVSNPMDPIFNQLQQQVLTQSLIVNLNAAYREIAVLQSEINALQSENNRLSSVSSHNSQYAYKSDLYSRDESKESIYSLDQIRPIRSHGHSRYDERTQQDNRTYLTNNKFENSSKTSFNSQSSGKQTAIHLTESHMERTPIKHERNGFSGKHLSSPRPVNSRGKPPSNEYEIPSNRHRNSTQENASKSFIIRRRTMSNEMENSHIKSQLFNYDHRLEENRFNNDEDSENEDPTAQNLSEAIFNIQPSTYYTTRPDSFDNVDLQKTHDQIKTVMAQLIPFMRLHVNDICTQLILNHIRDRIIFLFKKQPDLAPLIRDFQSQFSELIQKVMEKYCGTLIRDCATDLIRDVSDAAFDELIKYKLFENTNNIPTTTVDEQLDEPIPTQQDEYANMYDSSVRHYVQNLPSIEDGDNVNYQIELAESENRPITLVGSDEEDNDSDQEEDKDSELETAVSRQESNLNPAEASSSSEVNSNGHEYIIVNHSENKNNTVEQPVNNNDEEPTDENSEPAES